MSWHLVDGVPLPDPVGGHPALDFCNTRAGWGQPQPKEYLTDPRALVLWTLDAGLLGPQTVDVSAEPVAASPNDRRDVSAEVTLRTARELRTALYEAALHRGTQDDWDLISQWAARARAASRLVPGRDGTAARWVLVPGVAVAELSLLAVARAADDLLTSPLAPAVAACPGAGCGWLFADPRRRRRWCSMAVCGNRAKARRHAERRSTAQPHPETS